MILLYDKNISKNSLNHELNIEQSHHLYNVLRKRKGFELTITDGNGLEWLGKIYSFKNKKIELKKINLKIHKN
ncbi:MAG: RNA methyltransferase PUA domain-containing protein [Flavobacteriaceae bacterium]